MNGNPASLSLVEKEQKRENSKHAPLLNTFFLLCQLFDLSCVVCSAPPHPPPPTSFHPKNQRKGGEEGAGPGTEDGETAEACVATREHKAAAPSAAAVATSAPRFSSAVLLSVLAVAGVVAAAGWAAWSAESQVSSKQAGVGAGASFEKRCAALERAKTGGALAGQATFGRRGTDALVRLVQLARYAPSDAAALIEELVLSKGPKGSPAAARFLDAVNGAGMAAVHIAALHKEVDVFDLLVDHGANPAVLCTKGRTAGAGVAHFVVGHSLQETTVLTRLLLKVRGTTADTTVDDVLAEIVADGTLSFNVRPFRENLARLVEKNVLLRAPDAAAAASVAEDQAVSWSSVKAELDKHYAAFLRRVWLRLKPGAGAALAAAREDAFQRTPLHLAALSGLRRSAAFFADEGAADGAAKDRLGATPGHLAAARGYRRLAEILKNDERDMFGRSQADVRLPAHAASAADDGEDEGKRDDDGWPPHAPSSAAAAGGAAAVPAARCDFRVHDGEMDPFEFFVQHLLTGHPVLMRGAALGWKAREGWARHALTTGPFRDTEFEVGNIPYAGLFGKRSEKVKLGEFVRRMEVARAAAGGNAPTPDEADYVFYNFGLPQGLTGAVELPPKFMSAVKPSMLRASPGEPVWKGQFYLGPAGTGAPMHIHSDAFNALAYGRKSWWVAPPSTAMFTTSRFRMNDTRPRSRRPAFPKSAPVDVQAKLTNKTLLYCEQQAGDILYVPAEWAHATLNTQTNLGVAFEFRFARNFL